MNVVAAALAAALLTLAPGAWVVGPTAQPQAVSQLESGVWWVGQPKMAPALPPPNHVPADGLWVSSTAAGTVAMSAVRFTVGQDDRQPVLNVPIDAATTLPQEVPVDTRLHVLACATTDNWAAPPKGTFGALGAAPKYDCGKGQVLGAPSLDGTTMVFELASLVSDSNHTVAIALIAAVSPAPIPAAPVALPVAVPTVLLPPTFDITFKPLTVASIEVLTSPPAPVTEDEYGFDEPEAATYGSGASTNAVARFDGSPPPTVAPRGFAALPNQVARTVGAVTGESGKGDRTLAAAVFLALCMWAWALSNRNPLPGTAQAGRPYRTLYDGAPPAAPTVRPRAGAAPRIGKPPPLR